MLELCRISYILIVAWQPIWFGLLNPPQYFSLSAVLVFTLSPLLICLPWVWRKHPKGLVLAGCILLLHFSLAVTEVWANPDARLAAGVQVVLTVLFYVALTLGLRSGRPPARQSGTPG